jgi:hypothetical protein
MTAGCNTSAVCARLDERELLGRGRLAGGGWTDRDRDRARLLLWFVNHPEGSLRTKATHAVLKGTAVYDGELGWKGVDGNHLEAERGTTDDRSVLQRHDAALDAFAASKGDGSLDGSDSDYQFCRRFTEDLESAGLVRLEDSPAGTRAIPTLNAVDLISEGVSKTDAANAETVYDRDFCENLLKATRTGKKRLSDPQKDVLANSLRRYIRRIDDYRLVFDVELTGWRNTGQNERMTKPYKTRWSDGGRKEKNFARLQQSLEYGFEHAENAVFATLTTDPKKFDSLYEAITTINDDFNRLRNYFASDPSTKQDTRNADVPNWSRGRDDAVTGRPRENLEYVKVLEFTEAGYPHLHVLFFDAPTRDKDGMPWLIDKKELSAKWKHGEIVDAYPLTYRDDLSEIGHFGSTVVRDDAGDVVRDDDGSPVREPIDEGFVCWYNYGDHDHGSEWVESQTRYQKREGLIDMEGDDDVMRSKTAGSYIGKYVSKMFETLKQAEGGLDPETPADHTGEAAWWKLALYWATNRHFWSISHGIRDAIRLDDLEPDPLPEDAAAAVTRCTETTLARVCDDVIDEHEFPDFDLDDDRGRSNLTRAIRGTLADITFLGAYRYDDLPPENLTGWDLDRDVLTVAYETPDLSVTRGDRPPPVADVYA